MTESCLLFFLNVLECNWLILEESQYQFLFWIGFCTSLVAAFLAGYERCCRKHKKPSLFFRDEKPHE